MASSVQDLIEQLGSADLPILSVSAVEFDKLAVRGERAEPADIVDVVLHDPFFTLNVLRAMGKRKRGRLAGEVTTIEHAVMMFGAKPLFERFANPLIIENQFKSNPRALLQLRRALSRAHHAACQARDWAICHQDIESEEVYIAASLNDIAEQLLCYLMPEAAEKLTEEIRRDPEGTRAAQQAIFGFDLRALHVEIVRAFQLPDLLQDLSDPANMEKPRAQNVQLAASVARHAEFGWHGAALERDMEAVAVLLRLPLDEVVGHIHRTAALAARAWQWYKAPPAARWLPLLPPPAQGKVAETSSTTMPAVFGSTQEVMAWAMRALQEQAGLNRAVFALRTPDGQHLRAKFALGVEPGSPFAQFEIGLAKQHLFAHLLSKPQSVWFNQQNQANLQHFVTTDLSSVVGSGEFFASSLFLGAKPFGLFYGDRRDAVGGGLDERGYQAFKEIGAKVSQALNQLAGKKS
ncbi:MAG: HDOD domain-containing protein [Pseudomonadota bacterium]